MTIKKRSEPPDKPDDNQTRPIDPLSDAANDSTKPQPNVPGSPVSDSKSPKPVKKEKPVNISSADDVDIDGDTPKEDDAGTVSAPRTPQKAPPGKPDDSSG